MKTVYVTNGWEKDFESYYAYKLYKFPMNETVEIPIEAACHIFGYMCMDKVPHMTAAGFIRTMNDIPAGLELLAKFKISEEQPKKNHSLSPVIERVPLPPAKGGKGKLMVA
jgi:hypothetical protein